MAWVPSVRMKEGECRLISVKISNRGKEDRIRFPCTERELSRKLEEIGAYGEQKSPHFYIEKGIVPKELAVLEGMYVDLDVLNYLAKRLDGMDEKERKQFFAAMETESEWDLRGLINLTFNLSRYTVIRCLDNLAEVGRTHLLTVHSELALGELSDKERLTKVGRELLSSGRWKVTNHGLAFFNEEVPFQEVYDGETFPVYDYAEDALLHVTACYLGRNETLYLPDEELALKKSLVRLGAESFSDCAMYLEGGTLNRKGWMYRMWDMIQSEGLYEVNGLLGVLRDFSEPEWDKLKALAEYAGAEDVVGITKLVECVEQFTFIRGVCTAEEVGQFLVRQGREWEVNPVLEPFLDLERFGTYVAEERFGKFVSEGFVYYSGPEDMEETLDWLKSGDGLTLSEGM